MTRVCDGQLTFGDDRRAMFMGRPFTGVAWESPSGGLYLSEVRYLDGIQDGESVDWYAEGQMAARQEFRHGIPHGCEEEWFEGGAKRLVAYWENGERVSLVRWNRAGSIVERW